MPCLILYYVSMPTWFSPSLHFSFGKKLNKTKKEHDSKHMSSNLLSISPKKNNGRVLSNERAFDF